MFSITYYFYFKNPPFLEVNVKLALCYASKYPHNALCCSDTTEALMKQFHQFSDDIYW